MSNEIKAALHVAMEAIDAKLRRTDLKPGHENDLRAAKGFLRSMISNLPAASGQQELTAEGWALSDVIEALRASGFEVRGEDATAIVYGTVEAGAVLLDASIEVFSQQENKGLELPDDHPISVHLRGLGIEPAAHPAPAQQEIAPAPAALTDEQIAALKKCLYGGELMGWISEANTAAILATASAAPAEQARSWLPIDSAPKDGREVILAVKMRAGIKHGVLVGHYMGGGHCIEDHPPIDAGWYFWNGCQFDRASVPTHWMPMPNHPDWISGGWQDQKQNK